MPGPAASTPVSNASCRFSVAAHRQTSKLSSRPMALSRLATTRSPTWSRRITVAWRPRDCHRGAAVATPPGGTRQAGIPSEDYEEVCGVAGGKLTECGQLSGGLKKRLDRGSGHG